MRELSEGEYGCECKWYLETSSNRVILHIFPTPRKRQLFPIDVDFSHSLYLLYKLYSQGKNPPQINLGTFLESSVCCCISFLGLPKQIATN